MKKHISDILVIGAGAAGLSAASKAKELGVERVVLLDEKEEPGGVLPQCIHPGFGLQYFKEDLTGPEFSYRLYDKMKTFAVEVYSSAYAMELCITKNKKKLKVVSSEGLIEFNSKTVIITSGARERHSFEIGIAGYRPAGIYTAGQTQTMMDLYGVMPGKEVVIIGSGDVGLIMARRFTLQGAEVKAVVEILPYPGGLIRNVQQCLLDFDIPLYLSHKTVRILGKNKVKGLTIVKVDEKLSEIPGTEFEVKCDTVIISAGLIPRVELLERVGVEMDPSTRSVAVNELLETSIPGVFVAGNALVINDLVDYAAIQGETAARSAVNYIQDNRISSARWKPVIKGRNLRLIVPQYISGQRDVNFYARVMEPEERVCLTIPEIKMNLYQIKMRPPEMLNFIISKRKFEILQDDKLTVSIETRK